jgi:hypothetical protein
MTYNFLNIFNLNIITLIQSKVIFVILLILTIFSVSKK